MMSHITLSLIWAVYGTSAAITGYLLFLYMRRERELKRERQAVQDEEERNYKDDMERTLSLQNPAMPPVPRLEHMHVSESTPAELELSKFDLIKIAPCGRHIGKIQWIEGGYVVIDAGRGKLYRLPLDQVETDHAHPVNDEKVIDVRVDATGHWTWQHVNRS
ncbi:hypothetical protein MASR1M60_18020 [Rhodocyclaceae bacterium]